MAVRIRLLRMGKIRHPQYRIVVADSRTKRDGRAIEEIGIYHPKEDPSRIEVNSERVQHWLSVGAQPSDPVKAILSTTGDWQKFKVLPAPTEPLKVAAARVDRTAIYEAEAQAAAGVSGDTKPASGYFEIGTSGPCTGKVMPFMPRAFSTKALYSSIASTGTSSPGTTSMI